LPNAIVPRAAPRSTKTSLELAQFVSERVENVRPSFTVVAGRDGIAEADQAVPVVGVFRPDDGPRRFLAGVDQLLRRVDE
jgi:hypothetical protein